VRPCGVAANLPATDEMLIPGCSVSSMMAFFSQVFHRWRRCRDVMISTGPIDACSLMVVVCLYLFLQLISTAQASGQNGGYSTYGFSLSRFTSF